MGEGRVMRGVGDMGGLLLFLTPTNPLCNSNKPFLKNKGGSLKSSEAVKQISHFMREDNPFNIFRNKFTSPHAWCAMEAV